MMQAIYAAKRRKGSIIQIHGVNYAVTYTRRIPLRDAARDHYEQAGYNSPWCLAESLAHSDPTLGWTSTVYIHYLQPVTP